MSHLPPRDSDDATIDSIEEEASRWLAEHERGLTPAQHAAFHRWRQADPRHAEIFAEVEALWRTMDRIEVAPGARRLRAHADEVLAQRRLEARRRRWQPGALAVAAAVAIVIGIVRFAPPTARAYDTVATTALGEQRTLPLPDGSTVVLNTDTELSVRFTLAERVVELRRGEAHFTVAKNAARPFVVRLGGSGGVAVRAVGTAFNIRCRGDSADVLVTEGRVRVDDSSGRSLLPSPAASDHAVLSAGQQFRVAVDQTAAPPGLESAPPVVVEPLAGAEIARTLAWRSQRLDFFDVALAEVVVEFNRYNREQLVIADPLLGLRKFGGTFRIDEPHTFVEVLERNFSVVAGRQEGKILLRPAR